MKLRYSTLLIFVSALVMLFVGCGGEDKPKNLRNFGSQADLVNWIQDHNEQLCAMDADSPDWGANVEALASQDGYLVSFRHDTWTDGNGFTGEIESIYCYTDDPPGAYFLLSGRLQGQSCPTILYKFGDSPDADIFDIDWTLIRQWD